MYNVHHNSQADCIKCIKKGCIAKSFRSLNSWVGFKDVVVWWIFIIWMSYTLGNSIKCKHVFDYFISFFLHFLISIYGSQDLLMYSWWCMTFFELNCYYSTVRLHIEFK